MRILASLSGLLLLLPLVASAQVSLVAGTEDAVQIAQGEQQHRYFRLMPGEGRLGLVAEGPVVLSVRLRVLRSTPTRGVLRVYRDGGPFSDNAFDLDRDPQAVVETSAAAELNAASVEKVFHVAVPAGSHRYELAPLHGGPVALRVTRIQALDPALALAPEREVAVVAAPAMAEGESVEEEPERAEVAALTVTPPVRPSVELELSRPAMNAPAPRADLLTPDQAFVAKPEAPKGRLGGPAISARGGAHLFFFQGLTAPSSSAGFTDRHDLRATGAVELAWDLSPQLSLFLDGAWLKTTRQRLHVDAGTSQDVRVKLRVAPVSSGVSWLLGEGRVGLRLKAGATLSLLDATSAMAVEGGALVDQPSRRGLALGGTAGAALEVKAGPGRFVLEARVLAMMSDLRLSAPAPEPALDVEFGPLHAAQVLLGYRLEL